MTVMRSRGRRRRDTTPSDRPVRQWLGQIPYILVLCGVAAGLFVLVSDHFKRGAVLIAAAVFFGAVVRLVLPESRVGMLAVRSRVIDVLILTTLAVGIAFVAVGVPPVK